MIYTDWQQKSGDVNAALYGAMFARVADERDDGHHIVELVKVTNLQTDCPEAVTEDGVYLVESGEIDFERDISREKILEVMRCVGGVPDPSLELPEDEALYFQERRKLAAWNGTPVDPALAEEEYVIRCWYSLSWADRAIVVDEYEGVADNPGYYGNYATLADAMRSHDIPTSALWDEKCLGDRPVSWGPECPVCYQSKWPAKAHIAAVADRFMEEKYYDNVAAYPMSRWTFQLLRHLVKLVHAYNKRQDSESWHPEHLDAREELAASVERLYLVATTR